MIPGLDAEGNTEQSLLRGSRDLGGGFVLLRARKAHPQPLRECEANALLCFLHISSDTDFRVRRWAKLRLPTGQIAHSAWKEKERPLEKRRTACNVKILLDNKIRIAEVYFYVVLSRDGEDIVLGLVLLFSKPDPTLLQRSVRTLWSCEYQGDSALVFIDVKSIQVVVSMIPHTPSISGNVPTERFFLVEKPGLDVIIIAGMEEHTPDDETEET
ncbi:hypothetical protein BC827DRAFT_1152522 [Russula dissimulans]|nr:hypothetical protein BC827DRAFT_1152522 [Russula dissimulans]